ncbi:hypothetical protein HK104_005556 [Borealophlyctis nickersoniae]|nr:hypothetical protein HK104_005556 [Borealophlyctis nickersoniae]
MSADLCSIFLKEEQRIYTIAIQCLFWISLVIADISISVLMVHTLSRVFRELDRAIDAPGSGTTQASKSPAETEKPGLSGYQFGVVPSFVSKSLLDAEGKPGNVDASATPSSVPVPDFKTRQSSREQMARHLQWMLVAIVVFDIMAFSTLYYVREMGQIAEAWSGLHTLLGLRFLSRIKDAFGQSES